MVVYRAYAIHSFLNEYDFKGKTVIPFGTHGTGGLASTIQSMAEEDSSLVQKPPAGDGNSLYINVMNRLSVDCDCDGNIPYFRKTTVWQRL